MIQGGQDLLGYFDHFLIRGMNAQIYEDGFSDGDQLGGVTHSLNGVKQVELVAAPAPRCLAAGRPAAPSTSSTSSRHRIFIGAPASGRIVGHGHQSGLRDRTDDDQRT